MHISRVASANDLGPHLETEIITSEQWLLDWALQIINQRQHESDLHR